MPEMEAAIGCVQLGKLPSFLEARSRHAASLSEAFRARPELQLPVQPEGYKHAWYVYTVRLKGSNAAKRDKVVRQIREKRVDCQVYYPKPIHLQPFYKAFCSDQLMNTETAARQVFSLPVHPSLSENDLSRIVNAVEAALE
jgi:dTDP-4-amino-4,6-dideoxygalactose transaminase